MGLLTGFSILSGVEIVYYLLRFQLLSPLKISPQVYNSEMYSPPQVLHVSQGSKNRGGLSN